MDARFYPPAHRYHPVHDSSTLFTDCASSEAGSESSAAKRGPKAARDLEFGRRPICNRRGLSWSAVWLYVHDRLRRRNGKTLRDDGDRGQLVEEKESKKCASRSIYRAAKLGAKILILILASIGILHLLEILVYHSISWSDDDRPSQFLPIWGQPDHVGAGLKSYPTDFTRDVVPLPCHSHNDYWRRVPLYEAIHYGCTSVEADVWSFPNDDELYVGHSKASLTRNRTLRSLYIDPIVKMLDHQNPTTEFVTVTHSGVFDEQPNRTLILLIDFKTSGPHLWPHVQSHVEPLRSGNYLTYFNGTTVIHGPVTLVGTGNCPFDLVTANITYRDIFFDAPLDEFWDRTSLDNPAPPHRRYNFKRQSTGQGQGRTGLPTSSSPDPSLFNLSTSYYASVSFIRAIGRPWFGRLSPSQIDKIRGHIKGAQAQGLKARFWDTPAWPVGVRNHVWDVLVKEGVDVLNVDDLKGATKRDWGTGGLHWWW